MSSSENVKKPLFMSSVRGANILAVVAFGLSELQTFCCIFLKTLAVAAVVEVVVVVVGDPTTIFVDGPFLLSTSKRTGPSPAGNKNVVESTRHLGRSTFSVDDVGGFLTACCCDKGLS